MRDLRVSPGPARQAEELRDALRGLPYVSPEHVVLEPVVVTEAEYTSHFDVAARLLRLVERTCWEDGRTPSGLRDALGAPPGRHRLLTDGPDEQAWAACMSRMDGVVSGGVLKIVECNVGGAIGAVSTAEVLTRHHRQESGLAAESPFRARSALFGRACAARGVRPRVGLLGTMRDPDIPGTRMFDLEVEHLRQDGFEAAFVEPEELRTPAGFPWPVVLRHFLQEDWDAFGTGYDEVERAQRAGVLMLAPESAFLLQNKKVLAWISEGRDWMTAADRLFVERHVPWTRIVSDRDVLIGGRSRQMQDVLLSDQHDLVLKSATGYGGKGVLVGRYTDAGGWRAACAAALADGASIVQQYHEPDPMPVVRYHYPTARVERLDMGSVLGLMVFDQRPAGCLVRHAVRAGDPVINTSRGALHNILMYRKPQ